jgi:hypothetical protein
MQGTRETECESLRQMLSENEIQGKQKQRLYFYRTFIFVVKNILAFSFLSVQRYL